MGPVERWLGQIPKRAGWRRLGKLAACGERCMFEPGKAGRFGDYMLNCKIGDTAFIVRPWIPDRDIGRPVEVIRRGAYGEVVSMRNGGDSRCVGVGDTSAWLCDAQGLGFPCFIADECLLPIRDSAGEDESLRLVGKPADSLVGA